MKSDDLWQQFITTGDPVSYLLYRAESSKTPPDEPDKNRAPRECGAPTD